MKAPDATDLLKASKTNKPSKASELPPPLAAKPQAAGAALPSLLAGWHTVFAQELRIAFRRPGHTLAALMFFVMVVSLFPLGVGPEPALLRRMAAGVVWVAALLACMLSLSRLFADDWQDGTLESLLLSAYPLPLLVLAKLAAHWCSSVLLLVLISPVLALQFDLSASATGVLFLSLLLGTPVLSLVGAIGAALTVGLRGAGMLMSLLTLPLLVPVLIFGAGAVEAHQADLGAGAHFSVLGALLLLALVAAPAVVAAALRIAVE